MQRPSQDGLLELRVFLVRHGLRQEDLAEGTGISRISISKLINGNGGVRKVTIDAILTFCRKYDPAVTYEQLFTSRKPRRRVRTARVASGGGR